MPDTQLPNLDRVVTPEQIEAKAKEAARLALKRPERDVCASLDVEFARMSGLLTSHKEVKLLCWTHTTRGHADRLRIDYVVQIKDGPLVGLEVKAGLDQPADLGRALFQCAQYAHGVIAPNLVSVIPPTLVGKPLMAVFLYVDFRASAKSVKDHALSAHRLYGPANVGFFGRKDGRFQMRLSGDRFWCERDGINKGRIATHKTNRVGNGNVQLNDE